MFSNGSDSDEKGSSSAHNRLNRLAQAKRDDMRETYEEERPHYKGKRRHNDIPDEGQPSGSDSGNEIEEEDQPSIAKKKKKEMTKAERMMANMGYTEGKGLGKEQQGRSEPVELSNQRGRLGLGHDAIKKIGRDFAETWDESKEDKTIEEIVSMIEADPFQRERCIEQITDPNSNWMLIGPKKMTLDDEAEFCDQQILTDMLKAKDVFDSLTDRELREARFRANPYETIGGAFFQNRAAMKTANLDKVFDWIFSQETEETLLAKNPLEDSHDISINCDRDKELFYFADVCAGPGGFSEYMLWRKAYYNAKGFGFTLRGRDDFKLGKFTACSANYFEPFYGVNQDGDVMNPKNIDSLEEFIRRGTNGVGVHMMMADGGFSVAGQENIQEILSKRLYLCELLVSLCIVREGGTFFCKLFDIFTPFSAGLVYLMYLCYDEISLHKPHTSRPANSERYIICKGLRKEFSDHVRDYLKNVNLKLDSMGKDSKDDVMSIVPLDEMKNDENFFDYLVRHNERMALRQTTYLKKYLSFAKNQGLIDSEQSELRDKCLRYWLVPNRTRQRDERNRQQNTPEGVLFKFCPRMLGDEDFNCRVPSFTSGVISNPAIGQLKHAEYTTVILTERANSSAKLLVSTGDGVFIYQRGRWDRQDHWSIRIPGNTVLLVDHTQHYTNDGSKLQKNGRSVRILDAAVLNGDNVASLPYPQRMKAATKFCAALKRVEQVMITGYNNQEKRTMTVPIVVAEYFSFEQLAEMRSRFTRRRHEGAAVLTFEEDNRTYIAFGLRIFRNLNHGWRMSWSKSRSAMYAYLDGKKESCYEAEFADKRCTSPFWDTCLMKKNTPIESCLQYIWSWENSQRSDYGPYVIMEQKEHKEGPTIDELIDIVESNKAPFMT